MKSLPKDIWIVGARRTPFGAMNGALKGVSATDLAVAAGKAALEQSSVPLEAIDHVVVGNVQQTSPDAAYISRHVGLKAGLSEQTPALTVNRLCGSGFQSVVTAAQSVLVGESKAVLAAGTENMSQAPHVVHGLRDGQRFGKPPQFIDSLWAALTDSYCNCPMAITAENLAAKYGISRSQADAFALRSQQRWKKAHDAGAFKDELTPLQVQVKRKLVTVDADEHPRPDSTAEALAALKPVFKEDGVVTAGNASGICDGAGALVVVDGEWGRAQGLQPLVRLVGWAAAGVDPKIMGIGPAPAIRTALERTGLRPQDIHLFDVNEAFAAQFLAVQQELDLPEDRTNIHGGAIALGHPLGASGARILCNLIYALRRERQSLAVGSACIGGGQGIAVVVEAV